MEKLKRKNQKRNKFLAIRNSLLRITVFLVIVGLNWAGLSAVIETLAYFNDTENSSENSLSAATLDFSIPTTPDFSPSVTPTATSSRNISIINDGILGFQYTVTTTNATGTLCDYLNLTANLDGSTVGTWSLTSFNYNAGQFVAPEDWQFVATLTSDDPSLENQTCTFDFIFDGVQIGGFGFYDQEIISNTITSGQWVVKAGDVVINELMWMGSYKKPEDEWIELRNMTSYPIDLSGWQLTRLIGFGVGKKEKLILTISSGKTIPANGYFLISNFSKDNSRINVDPDLVDSAVSLRNRNLQVKLYKGDWQDPTNLIDTADDGQGRPLAGWHGFLFHLSMERNDVPGDGTLASSWHTCLNFVNSRIYWDPGDKFNLGTPGAPNLSDEEDANLEYYIQLEQELLAEGIYLPDLVSEEENYDEEESIEEEVTEDSLEPDTEIITTTEEITTSTEEITPNEESPTIEETINEIPDETGGETTEDVIEEPASESNTPAPEEGSANEEVPTDETPTVEEQSATIPENNSFNQGDGGEGTVDGNGEAGENPESANSVETAGEISSGAGDSGENTGEQ